MPGIDLLQEAIIQENLEGWLFFNFQHRDRLADRFLGIDPEAMNTRPWYYFVPNRGEPVGLFSSLEPDILASLPGRLESYAGREQAADLLRPLACRCGTCFSPGIPSLSYLDHGTAVFLSALGWTLVSGEALIQRCLSLLNETGKALHQEAAVILYRIVEETWDRITRAFLAGRGITEREVQEGIIAGIAAAGLVSEHRPIVAAGLNSGNPHYEPGEVSRIIGPGEAVQLDLWGKKPGGIYGDISWVGWTGVPGDSGSFGLLRERFALVCEARDRAVARIAEALDRGEALRGRDVDQAARDFFASRGASHLIRHRTGHGIDQELHGWGVNLDSLEFPDDRLILEGSCFSVEPGLYDETLGCRTEINLYIENRRPVISGPGAIQRELLTLPRGRDL
jgi:Xaa-Pro aminopeptidase